MNLYSHGNQYFFIKPFNSTSWHTFHMSNLFEMWTRFMTYFSTNAFKDLLFNQIELYKPNLAVHISSEKHCVLLTLFIFFVLLIITFIIYYKYFTGSCSQWKSHLYNSNNNDILTFSILYIIINIYFDVSFEKVKYINRKK